MWGVVFCLSQGFRVDQDLLTRVCQVEVHEVDKGLCIYADLLTRVCQVEATLAVSFVMLKGAATLQLRACNHFNLNRYSREKPDCSGPICSVYFRHTILFTTPV